MKLHPQDQRQSFLFMFLAYDVALDTSGQLSIQPPPLSVARWTLCKYHHVACPSSSPSDARITLFFFLFIFSPAVP
ncbi:hypothetical protein VN97_g7903 [Penicillium thymicola]|uniref:Uncharacterized protein n=1 Tax=Penicillium thymicola TaxID=293382 RepID=A0AAI9X6M5_PENTH|nr:hypothetical protein VN97_g7903 [Penicillium thymicola]